MLEDRKVSFIGHEFECVDEGFGENVPVDIVVRPEDIYIMNKLDSAQFTGTVTTCIFKGVHYEMTVVTKEGYEIMIQDYNSFPVGSEVGMLIKPYDIQVMKKERTANVFDGEMLSESRVRMLGVSSASRAKAFQRATRCAPPSISIRWNSLTIRKMACWMERYISFSTRAITTI